MHESPPTTRLSIAQPKFAMAWNDIVFDKSVSDRALRLYLALCTYTRPGRSVCFPGHAGLAEKLQVSEPTIERGMRELIRAGWVKVVKSGARRYNRYHVLVPAPQADDDEALDEPSDLMAQYGAIKSDLSEEKKTKIEADEVSLPAAPAKERQRNPIFDALAEACGLDPRDMTPSASKGCGVASGELRKVGATPEEIERRVLHYRMRYPDDASLTPRAIAKHWPQLKNPPSRNQVRRPAPGMDVIRARRAEREGRTSVIDANSTEVSP